ncbi:MAG: hypothetical protein KJ646_00530 [Nanoarchaeota archaeon]|nr:hypothetical protein [Nanoarchaeota archaeon]MBU4116367.1 hypothetical protein [Nanoarchaeota archaeon]
MEFNKYFLVRALKENNCVEKGNYKLYSGKDAKLYYNIKKAINNFPFIEDYIINGFKEIIELEINEIDCFAGKGIGGISLACALGREFKKPRCLIRSSKKEYGTEQDFEGYDIKKQAILLKHAPRVAAIDDVFTTGKTLIEINDFVKSKNGEVLKNYVVVKNSPQDFKYPLDYLLDLNDFLELS